METWQNPDGSWGSLDSRHSYEGWKRRLPRRGRTMLRIRDIPMRDGNRHRAHLDHKRLPDSRHSYEGWKQDFNNLALFFRLDSRHSYEGWKHSSTCSIYRCPLIRDIPMRDGNLQENWYCKISINSRHSYEGWKLTHSSFRKNGSYIRDIPMRDGNKKAVNRLVQRL